MSFYSNLIFASLAALFLSVASQPVQADAQEFAFDPTHSQVWASWDHGGFSRPGAFFHISEGLLVYDADNLEQSSVRATIPVASVSTQVGDLDRIFKVDYFQADRFPVIQFESTSITAGDAEDQFVVEGKVTIRGISQDVTLNATLNQLAEHPMFQAPGIGFDATTTLKRSDFGLDAYLLFVSDEVELRITVEAVEPAALAAAMEAAN